MKPLIQLHLLVMLFSSTAILGRVISLSAPALVTWRTLLASLGAALYLACVSKRRGRSLAVGTPTALRLLAVGAIIGLHWVCFFGAIKVANVSICLAGMASISLFTAFTEPWWDKRRIRPFEVLLGCLVIAGIALIAGFERSPSHWLGLGIAMLSAFLASLFPVFNRQLIHRGDLDTQVMVAWEMAGAFLVTGLLLPVWSGSVGDPVAAWKSVTALHGWDWLWLPVLAWGCTVFAHGFHIHLLRDLSAYTCNLALNFEPVYGMAAAALLFGEHKQLHSGFYLGACTILLANGLHLWIPWQVRRNKARPLPPVPRGSD